MDNGQGNKPVFTGTRLGDDDLMPYGKHKGEKMANVPASYLLWMSDNDKCTPAVRAYVTDNYDALCMETGRKVPGDPMAPKPVHSTLRRGNRRATYRR